MGTQVTWISPYKFNQRLPFDIDYKVMGTFLEFYQGLLKFVNYKLFTDIGVTYPLQADMIPLSVSSPYLDCVKVQQLQKHVGSLFAAAQEDALVDFQESPEMMRLNKRGNEAKKQRKLLENCHFLIGRETPIYILQHLILSFGGSYTLQDDLEDDDTKQMSLVTHICMDRPVPQAQMDKSKEYVVPQYIADSCNNLFLLPTKPYAPGKVSDHSNKSNSFFLAFPCPFESLHRQPREGLHSRPST
jgi:pescadillo